MSKETKTINGIEYHKEIDLQGEEMWFSDWRTVGFDEFPSSAPEGCSACGGNYPNCASSCPIFDN